MPSVSEAKAFTKLTACAHHTPHHGVQHTARGQTMEQAADAMALNDRGEGASGALRRHLTHGDLDENSCFYV